MENLFFTQPKAVEAFADEDAARKNSLGTEAEARGEIVLYRSEDGTVKVQCRFENETIWMTQQLMADLFQTTQQNISQHIQGIWVTGDFYSTMKTGKKPFGEREWLALVPGQVRWRQTMSNSLKEFYRDGLKPDVDSLFAIYN